MQKFIFTEPGQLTKAAITKLEKNGVLVIEAKNPEKLKVFTDLRPIGDNHLLMAALSAASHAIGGPDQFTKELYRRISEEENSELSKHLEEANSQLEVQAILDIERRCEKEALIKKLKSSQDTIESLQREVENLKQDLNETEFDLKQLLKIRESHYVLSQVPTDEEIDKILKKHLNHWYTHTDPVNRHFMKEAMKEICSRLSPSGGRDAEGSRASEGETASAQALGLK